MDDQYVKVLDVLSAFFLKNQKSGERRDAEIVRAYHYRAAARLRAARHCPRQDLLAVSTADDDWWCCASAQEQDRAKLFTVGRVGGAEQRQRLG